MNQKKIGSFIKLQRKNKGLTQEQLAEQLNVSSKSVSRWENGVNMPDYSVVAKLCDTLEMSVNELLSGEKENVNANDISLQSIELIQKQKKKLSQGTMLLGCTIAFIIATIIFARDNNMAVVFGGISVGYLIAGMITLLKK